MTLENGFKRINTEPIEKLLMCMIKSEVLTDEEPLQKESENILEIMSNVERTINNPKLWNLSGDGSTQYWTMISKFCKEYYFTNEKALEELYSSPARLSYLSSHPIYICPGIFFYNVATEVVSIPIGTCEGRIVGISVISDALSEVPDSFYILDAVYKFPDANQVDDKNLFFYNRKMDSIPKMDDISDHLLCPNLIAVLKHVFESPEWTIINKCEAQESKRFALSAYFAHIMHATFDFLARTTDVVVLLEDPANELNCKLKGRSLYNNSGLLKFDDIKQLFEKIKKVFKPWIASFIKLEYIDNPNSLEVVNLLSIIKNVPGPNPEYFSARYKVHKVLGHYRTPLNKY